MLSAISFGWCADFGKPLPLFNGHPNRFILTNGKHPETYSLGLLCSSLILDIHVMINLHLSKQGIR